MEHFARGLFRLKMRLHSNTMAWLVILRTDKRDLGFSTFSSKIVGLEKHQKPFTWKCYASPEVFSTEEMCIGSLNDRCSVLVYGRNAAL